MGGEEGEGVEVTGVVVQEGAVEVGRQGRFAAEVIEEVDEGVK